MMHIKASSDLGRGTFVADSLGTGSQQTLSENKTSLSWGPENS